MRGDGGGGGTGGGGSGSGGGGHDGGGSGGFMGFLSGKPSLNKRYPGNFLPN